MKNIATISIVMLSVALGCAHTGASALFDGAEKGLAGVGEAVRQSEKVVDEATDIRIEKCRDAEDRAACMGQLAHPVADEYEKFGAAYDAAAEALKVLEAAYNDLAPIIREAQQEVGGR
jgi:hypothetical protein